MINLVKVKRQTSSKCKMKSAHEDFKTTRKLTVTNSNINVHRLVNFTHKA